MPSAAQSRPATSNVQFDCAWTMRVTNDSFIPAASASCFWVHPF